jgi:hypothetical protein
MTQPNLISMQAKLDKALDVALEVGGLRVWHGRKTTRRIRKKVSSVKVRYHALRDQMAAECGNQAIERRTVYAWPRRRNGTKRRR